MANVMYFGKLAHRAYLSGFQLTNSSVESVDTTEDGSSFTLHTKPVSWKQAFRSMEFTMRHSKEGHVFRPHEDLRRRQETIAPVNTDNLPTLTAPVPTAVSTASTNTLDVNHALINQDLLPANSSLQITCTNCSTYGSLDFSFASFEFSPGIDEILSDDLTLGDIFTGGEASVVAHGLGAYVELYTNISRSDDMSISLFEVPLLFGVRVSQVVLSCHILRMLIFRPWRSWVSAQLGSYMHRTYMLPTI